MITKVEDPNYEATYDERLLIANLISSFIARVPAEIEDTKDFTEEVYKSTLRMIGKIYAAKPKLFEQSKKRIQDKTGLEH